MFYIKVYITMDDQLIIRAGTAYPSGAHEFTPVFSGVHNARSLVLCVCFVDRCLSFCPFFCWPLYCLSLFYLLLLITPMVSSDYPYGIFKLFERQAYFIYCKI